MLINFKASPNTRVLFPSGHRTEHRNTAQILFQTGAYVNSTWNGIYIDNGLHILKHTETESMWNVFNY
jgi:hypothetical protein